MPKLQRESDFREALEDYLEDREDAGMEVGFPAEIYGEEWVESHDLGSAFFLDMSDMTQDPVPPGDYDLLSGHYAFSISKREYIFRVGASRIGGPDVLCDERDSIGDNPVLVFDEVGGFDCGYFR